VFDKLQLYYYAYVCQFYWYSKDINPLHLSLYISSNNTFVFLTEANVAINLAQTK